MSDAELIAERGKDHFGVEDYWNFCDANAKAQITALTWFRDEGCGHPGSLTHDEWKNILNLMIDGFQAAIDIENNPADFSYAEWDVLCRNRFKRGMALYVEWYFHLWD